MVDNNEIVSSKYSKIHEHFLVIFYLKTKKDADLRVMFFLILFEIVWYCWILSLSLNFFENFRPDSKLPIATLVF